MKNKINSPLKRAHGFVGMMLLWIVFGSVLVSIAFALQGWESLPAKQIAVYALEFVVPTLLYFVHYPDENIKETLWLHKISGRALLLCTGIAILIQPLMMSVSHLSGLWFHNYVQDTMVEMIEYPFWLMLMVQAVLPALCEEVVCRGIYLHGCSGLRPWIAVIMNGMIFGLMHMNLQQAMYAVIFGSLCAGTVLVTDSIFSSMWIHFLVNGMQVGLMYLLSDEAFVRRFPTFVQFINGGDVLVTVIFGLITAMGAAACFYGLMYAVHHEKTEKRNKGE